MSTTRFRRLWLVTCLALFGGLATAVPVNCLCDANQHWGQAIHPLFEHHHGDGHDQRASSPEAVGVALSSSIEAAALIVSEHGSYMTAAMDGLLLRRTSFWLALGLVPLFTLLPAARLRLAGITVAPAIGPPRLCSLFS